MSLRSKLAFSISSKTRELITAAVCLHLTTSETDAMFSTCLVKNFSNALCRRDDENTPFLLMQSFTNVKAVLSLD